MEIQPAGFALPLNLATPVAAFVAFVFCGDLPWGLDMSCTSGLLNKLLLVAVTAALWASAVLVTLPVVWNRKMPRLALDKTLFVRPTYSAVMLEQYMVMNRRPPPSLRHLPREQPGTVGAEEELDSDKAFQHNRVFICSTVYREDEEELMQLLCSIFKIDAAFRDVFESHIWMDGGCNGTVMSDFAFRLLTCIKLSFRERVKNMVLEMEIDPSKSFDREPNALETDTANINRPTNKFEFNRFVHSRIRELAENRRRLLSDQRRFIDNDEAEDAALSALAEEWLKRGNKIKTPYGHRFEFLMPTNDTPLCVHLKDPDLVKKKKVGDRTAPFFFLSHSLSQRLTLGLMAALEPGAVHVLDLPVPCPRADCARRLVHPDHRRRRGL